MSNRNDMAAPAPPVVIGGGCCGAPTKKRPAALLATDVCAEKRVKGSCWERSEDENVEAIREMRRESSLQNQALVAMVDRVCSELNHMRRKLANLYLPP
ncbi:hypothetical protein BDA96_09G022000 [Sorghum bicolor]|jgi:hypothetical protein|uniref:Uncharacterized protein n=2 Tax=Sorghum bicolor TaxID=4558 RepID=A0A921Q7S6_SORBI|nr:hypothetical protein BDA96_09G022000 [Sorghum bicolor]KXG21146.1 hypothetical protein SORBI_3009G021100 [Sorghum bicolor]